jgi:hypothetical protein
MSKQRKPREKVPGQKALRARIREIFHSAYADNGSVGVEWVVKAIMDEKGKATGENADFYTSCAWKFVKDEVYRATTGIAAEEKEQPLLPGYTHLRQAYQVSRDGNAVIVLVEDLTDDEIKAKIASYEAKRGGLRGHIKELRAYLKKRVSARALPANA